MIKGAKAVLQVFTIDLDLYFFHTVIVAYMGYESKNFYTGVNLMQVLPFEIIKATLLCISLPYSRKVIHLKHKRCF